MSTPRPSDVPPVEDWNRLLGGRVAVVTGAGDGIGRAIALLFAAHGAAVEIAEMDPDRSARATDAISTAGGSARSHVVDVTQPADVERLAADVLDEHG
ncbi:MAG: SDR family NAD(P)-dependent oxidoreductase, partial [Acidimicrobiales bacterium]